VNTMETYRKVNQWTSQSRDMVESVKRYYNNSFLDGQRQEAYNLFLGNYIFAQGQPMLWELSTDYYLHHAHPRAWSGMKRRSYTLWFTPEFLRKNVMPPVTAPRDTPDRERASRFDDYWLEYYRPLALSSFQKIFPYRMNSTLRFIPFKSTQEGRYDLSPFRPRTGLGQDVPNKRDGERKGRGLSDTQNEDIAGTSSITSSSAPRRQSLAGQLWLEPIHGKSVKETGDNACVPTPVTDELPSNRPKSEVAPASKSIMAQWTLDQFVDNSLDPSITRDEAEEYERYVSHPLNLPLVVTTAIPDGSDSELLSYLNNFTSAELSTLDPSEEDMADYEEFLRVSENPLTVTEADAPKKRYKAYRQWLKGKSLFKQQLVNA
jgi:hypothetical protein